MLLSVFDRLLLLNILPKHGDLTTIKLVHKLREDLSFSEEEHAALKFEQEEKQMRWSAEADVPKEVEIGPKTHGIICAIFVELDKQKQLTEEHLSLHERFVGAT